ncbi:mannose-1-phosphate guanylyltransferase/mannose-6-phosphate isomerase [SAR86 cluster bacterium]|nr:mannose-1-phosphate guanylyltransferase/mannose-6-phosphate isomerase [SAR86 cluster bacterium]|tara:strand:- start:1975 stop:3411 length:1437 start_codon:yes stop_codon:yes gene_type:complete
MKKVTVILSGGSGSRLWPVSRRTFPKPFMEVSGKTLLEHTIDRAKLVSNNLVIVTNQDHYFLTKDLVDAMGIDMNITYILEPVGRNTAPAITLASMIVKEKFGKDTSCLVLPSDHLIGDLPKFEENVSSAFNECSNGSIVVFGIKPTFPETGYGYIEVNEISNEIQKAKRFIEKPSLDRANKYLKSEKHFWNSGMFCFSVKSILNNINIHAKDIHNSSLETHKNVINEDSIYRFDDKIFMNMPDESIDYAVMEKSDDVTLIPVSFSWSDVGSWDSLSQEYDKDKNDNSIGSSNNANILNIDSSNIHVHSESHIKKVIATAGVDDLSIIDTHDALLVAKKSESHKVKHIVETLQNGNDFFKEKFDLPSTVRRPWGTYTTLIFEDGYQVKKITVKPEQQLSLQYHHKRAEHWVVVRGTALVQVGEDEYETSVGVHRHIPLGDKHRLTNIGKDELILIEVQYGSYLGEDDIVRLDDNYGRV